MERQGEHRLDAVESLRLLAGESVGRLIYTAGALPAVLPVRFRIDSDGSVLVRAGAGSDLARAATGGILAFETGRTDDADGSGWTVTVLGRASVADAPRPEAAATAPRRSEQVLIRLRPELISGRRLAPATPDPAR